EDDQPRADESCGGTDERVPVSKPAQRRAPARAAAATGFPALLSHRRPRGDSCLVDAGTLRCAVLPYGAWSAPSVSQLGLWTKSSVRSAAFSTAITKHTRSGPQLGNDALVYLTEIGSIFRQPSSGRTSTTRPWIAAIRYGLAMSVPDRATRESRRMSFAFQIASEVHTRMCSSSSPTHTTQLRGAPSARRVDRCT